VKLTLIRGALAALAVVAAVQAGAQTPTRSLESRAGEPALPGAGVATLTIDTRDTGVDLGLPRRAEGPASLTPRRADADVSGDARSTVDARTTVAPATSGIVDAPGSFVPPPTVRTMNTVPRLPPLAVGRVDAMTAAGAAARSRAQAGSMRGTTGTHATVVGAATPDVAPR